MTEAAEAIESVLENWFGKLRGQLDLPKDRQRLWWSGDTDIDADVRQRFGTLLEQALDGGLSSWEETARGRLALIILLDQFSRNLGRGTPAAFAGDARAQQLCLQGIECGHDEELRLIERCFFYMPLMHAEDGALARRCLDEFEALSEEIASSDIEGHPDFLSHAKQHADIVLRFGRYPHRNDILGRQGTEQERAYLTEGGPSFGQKKS